MVVLAVHLPPISLNAGTTDETFQRSQEQDSFRHILKSSASVYESLLQFFIITTEMQSGPDTFDESRLVMTFLTNLGATRICSLRLVLEKKAGNETPKELSRLEFLEKFLANNFPLLDAEDSTSGLLYRGGIADLLLLRTLLVICQKSH